MTSEFAIAVHTLVFLNHKGTHQNSDKIAENVCTNPATIRKILSQLKKAGLVETKEGSDGGFAFMLDPDKVSLDKVLEAVADKPVAVSKRTGNIDLDCQISSNMGFIMDQIYDMMNLACAQRLSEITVSDIDKQIFEC